MKNKKLNIIAEVAQGYEGKEFLVELFVNGFLQSKADIIKFQLIYADDICTPKYKYYKFFKSLEMNTFFWQTIVKKIQSKNKKIYFDVYGDKSLNIAKKIKADGVKISSTDINNDELIKKIFISFDNILLSVTGCTKNEIDKILKLNKKINKIVLLSGLQSEPTKTKDNNLLRITNLSEKYPSCNIGFMDHSDGKTEDAFLLSLIAIGAGANYIEKHITLDHALNLEDNVSALSVDNFIKFCDNLKRLEKSLGQKDFTFTKEEKLYRQKTGKVVVAKKNLIKNKIINKNDLILKRDSLLVTSKNILRYDSLIGKKLKKNILKNNAILKENIQ